MPENFSPAAVVCLAIGLVAVINVGLVLALTGGAGKAQIQLLQRAARSARDPWKREREAEDELHERVSKLTNQSDE